MSGEWQAKAVADIGDPAKIPLPVDISICADDTRLWVNTFMDGKTRFSISAIRINPKQVYEKKIGKQVNMVSQSWDGKRVYYTSSLLANWDKKGEDNEQYFKAYTWDGKKLDRAVRHRFHRARSSAAPTRCVSAPTRCTDEETRALRGRGWRRHPEPKQRTPRRRVDAVPSRRPETTP